MSTGERLSTATWRRPQLSSAATDRALAVGVLVATFLIYLRTSFPGLAGAYWPGIPAEAAPSPDAPKFQFLGRVLGTAHQPGYPLYVVVSHLFSWLPVGTVAFRANLMSGVFGAIAASLAFFVMRRLGCGRLAATVAALSLAFGRTFWSQSIIAEVYTLNAALVAAVLFYLTRWGVHGEARLQPPPNGTGARGEARPKPTGVGGRAAPGDGHLLAALAFFALGLGNHLTIVALAPVFVLYVVMVDRQALTRRPLLLGGVALLTAGLVQYLFIWLRTAQQAPYLGARASSIQELVGVVRATEFSGQFFAFDLLSILTERLPLGARWTFIELGALGVALALAGLVWLAGERPREAVLLGGAAGGICALAATLDVPDVRVFLIPAFVTAWIVAGFGLTRCLDWLVIVYPRAPLGLVALALPLAQLVTNYAVNDRHDYTIHIRYFDSLFAELPDRSAIVREEYAIDHMVWYKLLGERAAGARNVVVMERDRALVEEYRRRGYQVFAFTKAQGELALRGVRFAPVQLPDLPIPRYLEEVPDGSVVAFAAGEGFLRGLPPSREPVLAAIGGSRLLPGNPRWSVAAIGVAGAAGGAIEEARSGAIDVQVKRGDVIGGTGITSAAEVRVTTSGTAASVWVDGREIVRAEDEAALAIMAPGGQVTATRVIDSSDGLRVPFDMQQLPLYRVTAVQVCHEVGDRDWIDVSPDAETGHMTGTLQSSGSAARELLMYVASERPLDPRVVQTGYGSVESAVDSFLAADPRQASSLASMLTVDGVNRAEIAHAPYISRISIQADLQHLPFQRESLFGLYFGGLARRALARLTKDAAGPPATLCAAPLAAEAFLERPEAIARIRIGREAALVGAGWHLPETAGPIEFRWMAGFTSELLVPLAARGTIAVGIEAMPALRAGAPPPVLILLVNGKKLSPQTLRPGWGTYRWTVPPEPWKIGVNQLTLVASDVVSPRAIGAGSDSRTLAVAVSEITLALTRSAP